MSQKDHTLRAPKRFRPTGQQVAYLLAYKDLRARNIRVTSQSLGTELGRKPAAVRKMLYRGGQVFREWVIAELSSDYDEMWAKATHRIGQLAMEGSAEHYELFGKALGKFPQTTGRVGLAVDAEGAGGIVVLSLVPQRED